MASNEEQKAPAGRLVLLAALLALQVSAAVAFGRVLRQWRDARHLSQRTSQISIIASFQLSLFSGDYR